MIPRNLFLEVDGKRTEFRPVGGPLYSVFTKTGVGLGCWAKLDEPLRQMRGRGCELCVTQWYSPVRYGVISNQLIRRYSRHEVADPGFRRSLGQVCRMEVA